jgi:hypothetical protein
MSNLKHMEKQVMRIMENTLLEWISHISDTIQSEDVIFIVKGGRAQQWLLYKLSKMSYSDLSAISPDSIDYDTGIFINPNLPRDEWYILYHKVDTYMKEEMAKLHSILSNKLFDYYNKGLTVESGNAKIDPYMKVRSSMTIDNLPRKNFKKITGDDNTPFYILDTPVNNPSPLLLQYNYSISDFLLHRVMFYFYENGQKIKGEIFDLSISDINSHELAHIWGIFNHDKNISPIEYITVSELSSENNIVRIPCPTKDFIINDIEVMIQEVRDNPNSPRAAKMEKDFRRRNFMKIATCLEEYSEGKDVENTCMEDFKINWETVPLSYHSSNILHLLGLETSSKKDIVNILSIILKRLIPLFYQTEEDFMTNLYYINKFQLQSALNWYFKILEDLGWSDEIIISHFNDRVNNTQNTSEIISYHITDVEVYLVSLLREIYNAKLIAGRLFSSDEIHNWNRHRDSEFFQYLFARIGGMCMSIRNSTIMAEFHEEINNLIGLYNSYDDVISFVYGGRAIIAQNKEKALHTQIGSTDIDIKVIVNPYAENHDQLVYESNDILTTTFDTLARRLNEFDQNSNEICESELNSRYSMNVGAYKVFPPIEDNDGVITYGIYREVKITDKYLGGVEYNTPIAVVDLQLHVSKKYTVDLFDNLISLKGYDISDESKQQDRIINFIRSIKADLTQVDGLTMSPNWLLMVLIEYALNNYTNNIKIHMNVSRARMMGLNI